MKRKAVLFSFVIFCNATFSQEKFSLDVLFDPKMATFEDDHGNKPFTLNVLTGFSLQSAQRTFGYYFFGQSIEYAELQGGNYLRYSIIQVGYTFNRIPKLQSLECSVSANYGYTRRWSQGFTNYGANFELAYALTNSMKITSLLQIVRRTDIEEFDNKDMIHRASFFMGVKFNIANMNNI